MVHLLLSEIFYIHFQLAHMLKTRTERCTRVFFVLKQQLP